MREPRPNDASNPRFPLRTHSFLCDLCVRPPRPLRTPSSYTSPPREPRMRAIVTGQVGMDKKSYLEAVRDLAGQQGEALSLYHVGDIMYREAPDVRPGRILDLPLTRLNSLRRAAFKDIIADSRDTPNCIVNTHATFRWRHGDRKSTRLNSS